MTMPALGGAAAVGVTLAAGGVWGGIVGRNAAEGAETLSEAVDMAANAVYNKGKKIVKF